MTQGGQCGVGGSGPRTDEIGTSGYITLCQLLAINDTQDSFCENKYQIRDVRLL